MLGHQDEIVTSYRKSCSDLKERLKTGLDQIYCRYKDRHFEKLPGEDADFFLATLDPLVIFERKLLHHNTIKQDLQIENKSLQMRIKEIELDLQAKNVCLMKLKEDIVSHFVQIEFLKKHNENLVDELQDTRKKLKQFQDSQRWLKKYLFSTETDVNIEKSGNDNISGDDARNLNPELMNCDKKLKNINRFSEEWKLFHADLVRICHENYFFKEALHKTGNMIVRETKLKSEITESTPIEKMQKKFSDKLISYGHNENNKDTQIQQLITIIDHMKIKTLQIEFEKENLVFSVLKIKEDFMRIKDIQNILKRNLLERNSCTFSQSEKNFSATENEESSQALINSKTSLKSEKKHVKLDDHGELCDFSKKIEKIQFILDQMKIIYDDSSQEDSTIQIKNSRLLHHQKTKVLSFSTPDEHESMECRSLKLSLLHFLNRMKIIEEKYKKIHSMCTKNIEILNILKMEFLISHSRHIKAQAILNSSQLVEQKTRFEKYKRYLIKTIKQCRSSCISKDQENHKLQSLIVAIMIELKLLMKYLLENKRYMQIRNEHDPELDERYIWDNAIQKMRFIIREFGTKLKKNIIKNELEGIGASPSPSLGHIHCLEDEAKFKADMQESAFFHEYHKIPVGKKSPDQIQQISPFEQLNISQLAIEKLKNERSVLESHINQRDVLLGQIFLSFKQRMESLAIDISEKFFLQRLCNDLRSVIRIYGRQNKVSNHI